MRPLVPVTITALLTGCSTFQAQNQDPPSPVAVPVVRSAPPSQWPTQAAMPVYYSPQMPYPSPSPYSAASVPAAPANNLSQNLCPVAGMEGSEWSNTVCGTDPALMPNGSLVEIQQGEDGYAYGPSPAPGVCAGTGAMVGVSALAFIPIGGGWGSSGGNAHGTIPAGTVVEMKGGIESFGKIMESVNSTGLHGELQSALGHTSSQNSPASSLFTERHFGEFTPHFEAAVHGSSSSSSTEVSVHDSSTSSKK
jgi:hypothetical protein